MQLKEQGKMADLGPLGFNPAEVENMGDGFKVLPPGIYTVIIVESEVADTKNSGGKLLNLTYQVVDGPYMGDSLTDRINIVNKSDVAQKIGLSQLKHICDAIGHAGQLKDSTQLHGKPLSVKIGIESFKNKEGKELQSNRIEKRMPKQAPQVNPMVPPPETSASQSATRPWS
jgi:hypothetical protein